MDLEINWNALTRPQWQAHQARIPRLNLLQTYPYAMAIRETVQQTSRHGLIEIRGEAAGLVQIQEINFLGLIHFIFLDRGPLFFDPCLTPDMYRRFLEAFRKKFPRRPGRRVRMMPELPLTKENKTLMEEFGWRYKNPGLQSIWLDLTQNMDTLRAGLHQKWRRDLKASEKEGLELEVDLIMAHLPWLLKTYQQDRLEKKYAGASGKMIVALCKAFAESDEPGENAVILRALSGGKPVAAMLIFQHGTSATYQVGWISETGKKRKAHNFLYWKAFEYLKAQGVNFLDMGGIDKEKAEGVSRFKERLGGEQFELVGIYS